MSVGGWGNDLIKNTQQPQINGFMLKHDIVLNSSINNF